MPLAIDEPRDDSVFVTREAKGFAPCRLLTRRSVWMIIGALANDAATAAALWSDAPRSERRAATRLRAVLSASAAVFDGPDSGQPAAYLSRALKSGLRLADGSRRSSYLGGCVNDIGGVDDSLVRRSARGDARCAPPRRAGRTGGGGRRRSGVCCWADDRRGWGVGRRLEWIIGRRKAGGG